MVQTLEAIRGGGGSIKVGTTGTIGALMSKELNSTKIPSPTSSVSVPVGIISPKKLKTAGQASSSNNITTTGSIKNHKSPETARRTKRHGGHTHQIPMLRADNMSIDGTPIRKKPVKKGTTLGSNVVEIVDLKCGNPDRNWVNPITNRLKKLGFSKLSESAI